jgi:hypothetical protein
MDDVKYARLLQTPLTTIRQPCLELGATAMQAMINRISAPEAPARDYLVDFELVIRRSTDPQAAVQTELSATDHPASMESPGLETEKLEERTALQAEMPAARMDQY